ncbi:hypothetical protein DESA109040_06670 [Deinococcus saxicola]|uniref:hypothetical protein n=1 Tax=Deinococcus saxicola TaxID=249406 RepID=UPI0039EE8CD6
MLWLNSLSVHTSPDGDPGGVGWRTFAQYIGIGLLLAIPHLLHFRGWGPIWLGLGLGQSIPLLLAAITGVDRLSLLILELQGVRILESRNLWSILLDLVLPMPLVTVLTTPLALLLAAVLAWRRRSVKG